MSIEILPSLLVDSRQEFERRLRLVEHACDTVHIDILDGSLFPHISWANARDISAMRTNVKYELHLMVENPLPIIEEWAQHIPGFTRAIVHAEIHRPLGAIGEHVRDFLKKEFGVAINPETPLEEIEEVFHSIDALLVMGVHPGSSGQAFLGDYLLDKIRVARNHRPDLAIEIDGGVIDELLPRMVEAGATRVCAASLLFANSDPAAKLKELQTRLSTLTRTS
jgi:ribulose-phosphate 3-epimerase